MQDQAGRGLDQRRMEDFADEAITDQGDAEGSVHGCMRAGSDAAILGKV